MSTFHRRYVQLAPPGSTEYPPSGLTSEMKFRRGGFNSNVLPVCIQFNSAEQAELFWNAFQGWFGANSALRPQQFLERIFASAEFRAAANAVIQADLPAQNSVRIWWAVKYGAKAGCFMSTKEALDSVDNSSLPDFKLAFGFLSFPEALYAAMSNDKAPPGLSYRYSPAGNAVASEAIHHQFYPHGLMVNMASAAAPEYPSTPPHIPSPAPSTPSRISSRTSSIATPSRASSSTPSRAHPQRRGTAVNVPPMPGSPGVLIYTQNAKVTYNEGSIKVEENPDIPRTNIWKRWGRYYLQSAHWNRTGIERVETILDSGEEREECVLTISEEFPAALSYEGASFLYDLYHGLAPL